MNEEPEVTIQYDDDVRDILDRKYYHSVIRRLRTEIESQQDRKRAAILCFEIGRIFEVQMGDLSQASTHYQEALSKFASFLPAIRALRRTSLERGNWAQFISLTDQELRTIADVKKRSQLWLERAEVLYSQLGDEDETMVSVRKSLELDPDNARTLWFMDSVLKEKKKFVELVDNLRHLSAKVSLPEVSAALLNEAARICEVHLEDPDRAMQIYEEVMERDADNLQCITALHRLYYKKKLFRQLIKIMVRRAGRTAGRKKARILYSVARIHHERLSEINEAIGTLEQAHQADPESGLIIGELVRLCQLVGQYEKLSQYYEKQIRLSVDKKESAAICLRLGQLCEENLRNDEKAEMMYLKAIEEDPHYLPAFVQLANFYGKRGLTDNIVAMHIREAEITESPMRRAMAYHRAAELRENQEKVEEAIELYNKAIATIPSFTPSFNAMERLLEKSGNYPRIVLLYQERIYEEKNPTVKVSLMEKTARILEERLNQKENAFRVFRDILTVDPANISALGALIRITAEQEQWEEHIEFLLKEADITNDDEHVVDILQRVGEIYEHHLGSEERAIDTYQRILTISPFYPHAIRNLGRIFHRRGAYRELIDLHRSELGTATDPEERSMLLYKMGAILENNLDDRTQAVGVYRNALIENPRNMAASWALYRIYRKDEDWMSILEILEGEAASIPEGHQRALAFVRIGELWEESLGRTDMAYDSYNQALRMEPGLSEAREALLRLCEQEGDFEYLSELLFQEYQTCVDADDQLRLAVTLGELSQDRLKNPKEAAEWFMKALVINPTGFAALRSLESALRNVGEWKSLLEVKKKLVRSAADDHSKLAFLHELQMIKSRLHLKAPLDREEENLVAGIDFDTKNTPQTYDVIVDYLVAATRDAYANVRLLESREAMEEIDPESRATYEYMAGEALLRSGDAQAAMEKFEKAAATDPESIVPLLFLESLTYELRDAEKNIEVAGRLIEKFKRPELKAEMLLRTGIMKKDVLMREEEGIRDIIEGLRLDPENEDIFDHLVRIMGKEGRWGELIGILEEISEKVHSPKRISEYFSILGNLQWKHLRDSNKAIKSLNKVLKYNPTKIPALLGLLDLYITEEQVNEAIAISRYILSKVTDTGAYLTAALRMAELVEKGNFDALELITAMESLLKQNPEHVEIMEKLALLYQKVGDAGSAAQLMEKIASKEPEPERKQEFMLEQVRMYEQDLKDFDMAVQVLGKILEVNPHYDEAIRGMVRVLGLRGEWQKAADFLEKTLETVDEVEQSALKAELLVELAEILKSKLKDKDSYLKHLRQAFELDPAADATGRALVQALVADKRFGEAEELLVQIFDLHPFHFEAMTAGMRAYKESGKEERAALCANLVFYSGDRSEMTRELSMKYRKWTRSFPETVIKPDDLDRIRLDLLSHPARRILDIASQPGSRLFRKDEAAYGVSRSDNMAKKGERSTIILKECEKAATILGVDAYEVYLISREGYDPIIELFDAPAVLFPVQIGELSEMEQRVLALVAMSQIKLCNFIPLKLAQNDFEAFFVALVRLFHRGFGSEFTPMKKVEQLERKIEAELTKNERRQFEPLVEEYLSAPWFDIEEWLLKMRCTSCRIALLGCGDIGTVLDAIKKREQDLVGVPTSTPKAITDAFMKNDVARETARFYLSKLFQDLWRTYLKREG
jgi:tetratricopeptide (TPR) repeat protein